MRAPGLVLSLLFLLFERSEEQAAISLLHTEAQLSKYGVIRYPLPPHALHQLLVLHIVLQNVTDGKNSPLAYDWSNG